MLQMKSGLINQKQRIQLALILNKEVIVSYQHNSISELEAALV